MGRNAKYADTVGAVYDASTGTATWPDALCSLHQVVEGGASLFAYIDWSSTKRRGDDV